MAASVADIAKKAIKGAVIGGAFTMGGKKMVLDRGRFKEAKNVGSQSAKKASESFGKRVMREQANSPGGRAKATAGAIKETVSANASLLKQKAIKAAQKAGLGKEAYAVGASKRYNEAGMKELPKALKKMTGGGMATRTDFERAKSLVPKKSESSGTAKMKYETLKKLIAEKK